MGHIILLSQLLAPDKQRKAFLFSLWCTNENIPMLDEHSTTIPPWVIRPSDRGAVVRCFCTICLSLGLGAFHLLARFGSAPQDQTDLFGRFVFVGLDLAACGNVEVVHFGKL